MLAAGHEEAANAKITEALEEGDVAWSLRRRPETCGLRS